MFFSLVCLYNDADIFLGKNFCILVWSDNCSERIWQASWPDYGKHRDFVPRGKDHRQASLLDVWRLHSLSSFTGKKTAFCHFVLIKVPDQVLFLKARDTRWELMGELKELQLKRSFVVETVYRHWYRRCLAYIYSWRWHASKETRGQGVKCSLTSSGHILLGCRWCH